MSLNSWIPIVEGDEALAGRSIARDVAERLRRPGAVEKALEQARADTSYPRSIHWQPHGVAQGCSGLAVLFGAADASLDLGGWDASAHAELAKAVHSIERSPAIGIGLFSGLTGVAFATWFLSRDGARYRRLLSTIDSTLIELTQLAAKRGIHSQEHGVAVSTFDVISGLSGVGRYLLLRADGATAHRVALESVLRFVVALAGMKDGVPHWHTPKEFIADENSRRFYPHGNLNCGLAHGVAGPLALLSVAAIRGAHVERQMQAIRGMADILLGYQIQDEWGVTWPTAVPLRADGTAPREIGPAEARSCPPSRTAWCYGSPGIARALWLAGRALADESLRTLAVNAMEAVYRRPLSERHIDSPTFCHGVAGLQAVTLRFVHDTQLPVFVDAARALNRQMIDAYEPDSLLGYRNIEPGGRRTDHPGLLDGAAGVAIVLLAAGTPIEPLWDSLFLLS